jgi:hypothetical protein
MTRSIAIGSWSYTQSSARPIRSAARFSDTALMRAPTDTAHGIRRPMPIMREKLMNRTTLDVLLVVLLLAWVFQPLPF